MRIFFLDATRQASYARPCKYLVESSLFMLRQSENGMLSVRSQSATPVAAAIRPLIINVPVLQVRVLVGLIILLGLVVLIGDGLQGRP